MPKEHIGAYVKGDPKRDPQSEIEYWCLEAFGKEKTYSVQERVQRVIEEAAELAQSLGATEESVIAQVRHVFSREVGEPSQEAAGLQVCLYALSAQQGFNLRQVTSEEIDRIWQNIPKIQAKNKLKPTF